MSEFTMRQAGCQLLLLSAGLYEYSMFASGCYPALLWIVAGAYFQTAYRALTFHFPEVISRLAHDAYPRPGPGLYQRLLLQIISTSPGYNRLWSRSGLTPAMYYFEQRGIKFGVIDDPNEPASRFAVTSPTFWVYYQRRSSEIDSLMQLDYEACEELANIPLL